MGKTRVEFAGDLSIIRDIEDCIRATRKYTEGVLTRRTKHPLPTPGANLFPSRAFCKYYEVYPELDFEVGWDMDASHLLEWLRQHTCIDVNFFYDYRKMRATVRVYGGSKAVAALEHMVPGFTDRLARVVCTSTKRTGAVEHEAKATC